MFLTEYVSLALFFCLTCILCFILLVISFFITFEPKLEREKLSTYECGFIPSTESRYPFDIQFYLVAIMFLLFDIEILFLVPFVTTFLFVEPSVILKVVFLIIVIFIGIFYEISRNLLKFSHNQ